MKTIMVVATVLVLFGGCTDNVEELKQQNAAALATNRQLSQDLAARDEYVDKVTGAINDVYTNIEEIKAKEHSLMTEANTLESEKKLTKEEIRERLIGRIDAIRTSLRANYQRIATLQSKLTSSTKKYAGLQNMVERLKKTLEERDKSIADLGSHVNALENQITQNLGVIAQKDSVLSAQYKEITTAYYISGTRDELEKMGIISKEGGVLWGLLGSTTTLAGKFDDRNFKPLNKTIESVIEVKGKIDEIVPKRSEELYRKTELNGDQSMLTIAEPDNFWKDKYLVIITDRPSFN